MIDSFNSTQAHPTNVSSIEFFMTAEQQRVISELLPKGYSLQFASKPARSKSGSFTTNMASFARQNQQSQQQTSQDNLQRNQSNSLSGAQQKQPKLSNFGKGQAGGQSGLTAVNSNTSQQKVQLTPYQNQLQQIPSESDFSHQRDDNLGYEQSLHSESSIQLKEKGVPKRKEKKGQPAGRVQPQKKRTDNNQGGGKGGKNAQAAAMMAAMTSGNMGPEEFKKCVALLHSLQKHKAAIPFLRPVDPIRQGCADYLMVIRDPMDLGTVERNLKANQYHSPTQFAADIRKIWNNSYLYNSRDSQIYNMTLEMDKYFEKKFKEMENQVNQSVMNISYYAEMIARAIKQQQPMQQQAAARQAPQPQKKKKTTTSKMDIPMTMQEKKVLGQNILQLPPDCLTGVWEIVQSDGSLQFDNEMFKFDIDMLSVRKTRELEVYVKQKMAGVSRRLSKKQEKIDDKTISVENKLMQQTFGQDDETAATHHESIIGQDYNCTDIIQTNLQPYQVPRHPSQQYQSEQQVYAGQIQNSQFRASPQYEETKTVVQNHNVPDALLPNDSVQGDAIESQKMQNDNDSESSFMSGDSDSQNY